jgi:hypothetical protein
MPQADPYIVERGRLAFRYHEGQRRMMKSRARFVLVLAGTQGGKTVSGPWWMLREITRRGPGDYLVATPTFPLLELKCLPEYTRLFVDRLQLGEYRSSPSRLLRLSPRGEEVLFGRTYPNEPTRLVFGHAQDPDSLESMTVKAAHLDEAGQRRFRLGSWEAIQRRLAIHQGRVLITTTPYVLGWLKAEVHDRAKAGHPDYDLVQFRSTMNPAFPKAEYERMREIMPPWKFRMMYDGEFERPAGLIYDSFSRDRHTCPRFEIPAKWKRYRGLDFGGVNTAAVYLAEEPSTGKLYLYRTYQAGSRTAKQHADAMARGDRLCGPEPGLPERVVGGAWSEDNWRREFAAAGLPVMRPPVKDVEVGIDRVYSLFAEDRLIVFDDLADVLDDLDSYSRELDENDEPTEKIEDKETWHRLDALRYIATHLAQDRPSWTGAPRLNRM